MTSTGPDRDPADDLTGLDVAATIANPDGRDEYRRSIPYGRDGRPVHVLDQLATPPGADGWFDPADVADEGPR